MGKIIFPLIFIGEWILYFYVFLLVLALNIIYFVNVVYVDTAGEDPITITTSTASFIQTVLTVLLVVGLCIACFLYTKYFAGEGFYKRFKASAWGILFALNSIGSLGYLLMWYGFDGFDLRNTELILLLFIILVSVFLTIHIIKNSNK
ncbi:hypothetical protein [Psychrobacillus sp. OK032]|uniref:hypothetical protein n=1 Tax=Psychrobacillus sp. OK032 TaxID=1884358 RepID=UPI000B816115|nr:hypothetical protein [Psychrobacillus sp. OK032]